MKALKIPFFSSGDDIIKEAEKHSKHKKFTFAQWPDGSIRQLIQTPKIPMKIKLIPSPGGEDVMLKVTLSPSFVHRIVLARHELQELKVAIEEFQENQPFRVLKDATGEGK